jgi:hypothetical protein
MPFKRRPLRLTAPSKYALGQTSLGYQDFWIESWKKARDGSVESMMGSRFATPSTDCQCCIAEVDRLDRGMAQLFFRPLKEMRSEWESNDC